MKRITLLLSGLFLLAGCGGIGGSNIENVSYSTDVRPILTRSCTMCHSTSLSSGGVILSDYNNMISSIAMSTGDVIIVSGDAYSSRLYQVITTDDITSRMPKNSGPLSTAICDTIGVWINEGALNN